MAANNRIAAIRFEPLNVSSWSNDASNVRWQSIADI